MKTESLSGRALKQRVYDWLKTLDPDHVSGELSRLSTRRLVNSLFSFLHHRETEIRWGAVFAMGTLVAKLADGEMEEARVMMRRLMWNLNDESGGIGWGSPEAMGEILARHGGLAEEYVRIFRSYAMKHGNYLENETLQRGLLWGMGRIARVRPQLLRDADPHLMAYLGSPDASVRGMAAWVLGLLRVKEACAALGLLRNDDHSMEIFTEQGIMVRRVGDMAAESMERIMC